ncbi:MAG: site-specific integrase [Omnitrophica bacterium]|nr:site-specific integrase [Candidatus Omnitrophota bacterium]
MAWLRRRDNGFYYIYWYEGQTGDGDPKKCMKSLKTKNKRRAEIVYKTFEEKVYFRKQGLLAMDKIEIQAFTPRLESYLNTHFDNLHTKRKYLGHYRLFAGFMAKRYSYVRCLHEIKDAYFVEFKIYEQERGLSPHSINGEVRSLHKIFKIAKELNHINENPANGLSIIKAKKPAVEVYGQDEIRLMFKYSKEDPILDTMILLLLQTGARKEEISNFKWSDLNRDNNTLKVSRKDDWRPKRDKERILRLSDRLTSALSKLKRGSDYIFTQVAGRSKSKKFSGSQLYRYVIRDFLRKLAIKGHLHKFRDTYASYSLACGVDIAKVQHRLGHESLKETDRYAMAINETIEEDIKRVFIGNRGELRDG